MKWAYLHKQYMTRT